MLNVLLLLNLLMANLAFANIYPDTINQRRPLNGEEKQHLLHLGDFGVGGCSASALTPDTIITAEHCYELTSGYFELDPSQTFKVLKKLDVSSHYANDVMILKVRWTAGSAPTLLLYPQKLANTESQLKFGSDAEATKLFSIGYPHDLEKRGTYSSGFLKSSKLYPRSGMKDPYTQDYTKEALFLKVNVPLINGNSGGPVYTDDYKLVGIVSNGTAPTSDAEMKLPEFNSQNPKYWNEIGALYYLFPQMKTLQSLFPNGVNPDVNEKGEWIGKTN